MSDQEKINIGTELVTKYLNDKFPNCIDVKDENVNRSQLFSIDDGENISLLRIEKSFFENYDISQINMWLNDNFIAKKVSPEFKARIVVNIQGNLKNF